MKSERSSFPRSARASHRRITGSGDRTLVEFKCLVCGQIVETSRTMMGQSPERGAPAAASPFAVERISGKIGKKRPSNAIDLERLLLLSQRLYAHALTLQEMIRNEGEVTYELLKPRYDRQAARQFEIFHHALKQPSGFRKRVAGAHSQ